jgi:ATP-dependent DNA helicase RecG
MTTQDELLHLITQGEGQRLEFKQSLAELEDGVCTIAAFANAEGGTLLFGVRADGTVVGVTLGANTRERVVNTIVDNTDPPLYPQVEYLDVDGRTVIAVTVAAGHDRPHLAYGRAYRRVGAVTAQLSRDEQRRLLLESRPRFDDQPSGASLDDIDPARVRRFLEMAIRRGRLPQDSANLPVTEALRRLKVLRVVDGRLTPTMAAMLLFAREPQQFVPQSVVGLARFPNTTKGTTQIVDRADVEGDLAEIIDRAEAFVRRNTRIASKIYHARRAEITEYPFPAIREGIANAVIHRDYWQAGSRTQVAVYADRIEVENPGGLLPPITVETLGHTPPVWRNPDLAGLLYRLGYIEQFGTGIERMRRDMRAHGLPEPRFEAGPGWFRVTFPGPGEHILDLIPEEGVTDLHALGLNERQIEALALMVNEGQTMTAGKYAQLFGVDRRTAQRDLGKLVVKGQARRIGQGASTAYQST